MATTEHLAEIALPWLDRRAVNGRPVTAADIGRELHYTGATLQALDLAEREWTAPSGIWHAGPSATTLFPRATALAHYWRQHPHSLH